MNDKAHESSGKTAASDRGAAMSGTQTSPGGPLHRWGVTTWWVPVTIAEGIGSLIAVLVVWPSWWLLGALAVVLLLAAVVTFDQVTAAGWLARATRFLWWRRRKGTRLTLAEPFEIIAPGIGAVGMRWDGQYLVTMLALAGKPHMPTILDGPNARTFDTVPLQAIATVLRQFGGIELESADVLTVGRRAGMSAYAVEYDAMIGNRAAVGLRRTWLVLRLAPQGCLAGIAYRKSLTGAVAAATERIRQSLIRAGCRATICDAAQVRSATATIAAGEKPGEVRESWSRVAGDAGGFIGVYRVPAAALTTTLINEVWSIPTERTVVAVRVTLDDGGAVRVGGLVRMHTPTEVLTPPLHALETLPGQAFDAWMATLPAGERALRVAAPTRVLNSDSDLELPVGSSGPVVGVSEHSRAPMLVPMSDPVLPTLVSVTDDPVVLVQQVLRNAACGAQVTVFTDRPHLWAPLHPAEVTIAGPDDEPDGPFVVWDRLSEEDSDIGRPVATRGRTVLVVSSYPDLTADVIVDGDRAGSLKVTAGKKDPVRAQLQVMRTRTEARFLDHAEAVAAGRR
ncbi:type VII secretion protein EccE [Mycobacteroides chelonae]|uniref:type VII secretion protein EccE n=1 Tax=Mycobacteroides chelonae TaxID=1774 RepID=UPI000993C920|nr:type VII secretion protein EccE [Mycobacteroides chelonae]